MENDCTKVIIRTNDQVSDGSLKLSRAIHVGDIEFLRDIVREYHAESRYSNIPFSTRKFENVFERAVAQPGDTLALYVSYRGRTVGFLHAGIGEYYLGNGGAIVTVYALYASSRLRPSLLAGRVALSLLRALGEWSREFKAEEIQVHSTSGIDPERTDRLLKRLNFRTVGGNYVSQIKFEIGL